MRSIICIGGSLGALNAIHRIVEKLPADLPAAVFIVRHTAPVASDLLAPILQPKCALPVSVAIDGEAIEPGRIYIAPADRHLVLEAKSLRLLHGPKENWARPAIDPLFRTAAQFHGPRSIGVILSGKLDDGTAGLWALKRRGGFAVVQDPKDAEFPEMPSHAIQAVQPDIVTNADKIGLSLSEWCKLPASPVDNSSSSNLVIENAFLTRPASPAALDKVGKLSGIACPECDGPLWQLNEGPLRFRCHVGHTQSAHSLLAQQEGVVESAAWRLIRAIEEDIHLTEQIARENGDGEAKERLGARLVSDASKLRELRKLLT